MLISIGMVRLISIIEGFSTTSGGPSPRDSIGLPSLKELNGLLIHSFVGIGSDEVS